MVEQTLVTSHVQLIIWLRIEPFPASVTVEAVAARVDLHVDTQATLVRVPFAALVANVRFLVVSVVFFLFSG